jgi:serine/threonine protein kinase
VAKKARKRRPAPGTLGRLRPGAVVGGYTVERPIARRHDGLRLATAYHGRAPDGTLVVVKLFDPDPRLRPEQVAWARRAFEYERRCLLDLDHPSIPKLLGADLARPRPVLIMQHMPGEDLHAVAPDLSRSVLLAAARGLAEAVAHIHARAWCHLDLKADHLLLTEAGDVALIDLGNARPITPYGVEKDTRELGGLALSLAAFPLIGPYRALAPDWRGDPTSLARWVVRRAPPELVRRLEADPVVGAARSLLAGDLDAAWLADELAELEQQAADGYGPLGAA